MTVLGVAGKAGSGKSTIASALEKSGAIRVSLDEIGHQALDSMKEEIRREFGECIMTGDSVDRKKLGDVVFNSPKLLERLNRIVHPVIRSVALAKMIDDTKLYVIDGALLHQIGLSEFCDKILWIECSPEETVRRLALRGMTEYKARLILQSQQHLDSLRDSADAIVDTSGDAAATLRKVEEVLFEWGIML